MKTTRAMTLLLKPRLDERVKLSLTGTVLETSLEARRSLLGLTSLWVRPEPLRVALCADERGSWAWADGWTDALKARGCRRRQTRRRPVGQTGLHAPLGGQGRQAS